MHTEMNAVYVKKKCVIQYPRSVGSEVGLCTLDGGLDLGLSLSSSSGLSPNPSCSRVWFLGSALPAYRMDEYHFHAHFVALSLAHKITQMHALSLHAHTQVHTCTCTCTFRTFYTFIYVLVLLYLYLLHLYYHSQNWLCGPHSGGEPAEGNKTGGSVGSGDSSLISSCMAPSCSRDTHLAMGLQDPQMSEVGYGLLE